jgi:putative DNA primase/helicase
MPHLRRDVERFKAFVSRSTDRYRRAYDKLTKDWPRQATLVGTSNDLVYLDTTGNRRFWAIPLATRVDIAKIAADRDQIWAEATHRWKNKETWWLSDALEEIAAEIQAGYVDDDLLEVPIEDWIDKRRASDGTVAPFEMAELYPMLREPLGLGVIGLVAGPTVLSKADQGRVANCLKRLGFRKERRWHAGRMRALWGEQTAK